MERKFLNSISLRWIAVLLRGPRSLRAGVERRVGLARDCSGAAAVEFALIAPMLLLLMFGIFQIGVIMINYVQLTNAVAAGARELSISRGSSYPYTNSYNAITEASPSLSTKAGFLTITMTVTPPSSTVAASCATDYDCTTALTNAAGGSAKITATYPCFSDHNYVLALKTCLLSSSSVEMVQ
jgi:Flp pilus assembly protein TadG